ncbi:MAG: hypothetical protein HC933_15730 [Pleurocapsa sp. SU_196_0]|nr:hypothetical protein [Pleurocapsa sp. SU_196_0]
MLGRRALPNGKFGGKLEELLTPFLPLDSETAAKHGTMTLPELETHLGVARVKLECIVTNNFPEPLEKSLDRLREQVLQAAKDGADLIVLEDRLVYRSGNLPIDPALGLPKPTKLSRPSEPKGRVPSPDEHRRLERCDSQPARRDDPARVGRGRAGAVAHASGLRGCEP